MFHSDGRSILLSINVHLLLTWKFTTTSSLTSPSTTKSGGMYVRQPNQDFCWNCVVDSTTTHHHLCDTDEPKRLQMWRVYPQVHLETHYGFEAFLFRCILTWLCTKRDGTTTLGVFSGTSSSILNYNIKTDLLKDSDLEKLSPSRDLGDKEQFYSKGFRSLYLSSR